MKILLSFCLLTGNICIARQHPIPMKELMEITKWTKSNIKAYVTSKGFPFACLPRVPNELTVLLRNAADTVWTGEHMAAPPFEDDDSIKRTFMYCGDFYSDLYGDCVFFRYTSSDPAEFELMKEYIEANPEYIFDPEFGNYSNGSFSFRVQDARIQLNTFGRGGFIRRYLFQIRMPKRLLKK
jgi:hypothetical protein